MVHIVKTKTGFMVVTVAKNGEPLSTSEVLSSKQKCWTNVKAQIKAFENQNNGIYVQDDVFVKSIMYYFYMTYGGKWIKDLTGFTPKPKYKSNKK
jgi:hypothetical protein